MEPDAEERFAALASRMSFIEKSVDGLDRRCADIEGALMTNTALTHDVRTEITGMSALSFPTSPSLYDTYTANFTPPTLPFPNY